MEKFKYHAQVTSVGDEAQIFLRSGILIIFDNKAPADLLEISVGHTKGELTAPVKVGDSVFVSGNEYKVTFVGSEANETLFSMGHATFRLNWDENDVLPGDIIVTGKYSFNPSAGDVILII